MDNDNEEEIPFDPVPSKTRRKDAGRPSGSGVSSRRWHGAGA